MFNMLKVLDCGPDAGEDSASALCANLEAASAELTGVKSSVLGATLPGALNGGHVMWRAVFDSEAAYWACTSSTQWQSQVEPLFSPVSGIQVDTIAYPTGATGTSNDGRQGGIWRCLVLALDADVPKSSALQLERDLMLMPPLVSSIRRWALSRATSASGKRRWTHVWEQEFTDLDGLNDEYMNHPIHWGLVDGWFDAECPQRIVDPWLIHAAIPITTTVIAKPCSHNLAAK